MTGFGENVIVVTVIVVVEVVTIKPKHFRTKFLDASLHLYMRVCPSVGRLVGQSICPSISQLISPYGAERYQRVSQ